MSLPAAGLRCAAAAARILCGGGAGIRMLCARNTSVAMPIDDESESEIEGGGGEGEN